MICPLSQQRSWKVRLGFGIQPNVYELRDGADDEGARSAVARHGEEDHLVASSGDHRSERAHDAALAGTAGGAGLCNECGSLIASMPVTEVESFFRSLYDST